MSDDYEYHSSEVDLSGDPEAGKWSIRCLDVHKRLGGVPVLNGLNVAIPDDTVTVVLGQQQLARGVQVVPAETAVAGVGDPAGFAGERRAEPDYPVAILGWPDRVAAIEGLRPHQAGWRALLPADQARAQRHALARLCLRR